MSLANAKIVSHNPNDNMGGGCLCHPDGRPTGCTGPYINFHQASMYQAENPNTEGQPFAVVSVECAAELVRKAGAGDIIDTAERGGTPETAGKRQADMAWTELPAEDRSTLEALVEAGTFEPGEVVGTQYGFVQLPGETVDGTAEEADHEQFEESMSDLDALAAEHPLEVPGEKEHTYEQAED